MSNSRHPREAVDFFRFMTSRKMVGLFSRMRDIPTAVRGASEGNLSPDLADVARIISGAKVNYGNNGFNVFVNFPVMQTYWDDILQQTLTGKMSPPQAAKAVEAAAQAVRARVQDPTLITVRHVGKPILLLGLLSAALVYWLMTVARGIRAASAVKTHDRRPRMAWSRVLLFTLPALLVYSVFVIAPCLRSLSWSLHEWNGLTNMDAMTFRGLLNFKRLLVESDAFWIALNNNLFLMIVVPLFVIPLALFLAACISRGIGGAKLFRVVFFGPNLFGAVAITLLWMHLYNPQGGPVNAILTGLGLKQFAGFAWLSPEHLYWALIPLSVWGTCGFNMVLYLAAMENIPPDLYEAAELDGVSPWRQFWHITLPLIWDVLAISVVFMVIGGMKAFEIIWLLTNQRPLTQNHVVGTRMLQAAFAEFHIGEATAIAVLLFLMVFVGSAVTLRVMKRETVELA